MAEKIKAKKALVVTTVASTIDQFCMNDISLLQREYQVHVAANFISGNNTSKERVEEFKEELKSNNIIVYNIEFSRNPLDKKNFFAYKQMVKLIEKNNYDIIHCHTPIAATIVRLSAQKARKNGTKVLYTAHGFHFFKGAPLKNWLIYYPVEYFLAKYTDVIITINLEDYKRAKRSFKAKNIKYIPGVGIDISKFNDLKVDKVVKRKELGVPEEAFVVLSVGELNKNKNHLTIIKAIAMMNNTGIHYVICGKGKLENKLKEEVVKLGLEKQVHLLGFRKDIAEICKVSDVFVFPSKREGLGLAALEAMASGLPIVTSNIHGINDYSVNGRNGFTCNPKDVDGFCKAIKKLYINADERIKMSRQNIEDVKKFDIKLVEIEMMNIYKQIAGQSIKN